MAWNRSGKIGCTAHSFVRETSLSRRSTRVSGASSPSRDALTGEPNAGFQKRFAELRRANMQDFARSAQFNHYYRLAVNTRIAASEAGKTIRIGDPLLAVD